MAIKHSVEPGLSAPPAKPGFFRYIAAIFYDLILVVALFFVATAVILPLNQGEAIKSPFLYPLYLFFVSFIFYGWFWTHGGQTLGLRAWKLRLVNDSQEQAEINWKQALIRYLTAFLSWALLGLGIVWRIWQKDNRTWQDLSSKSFITHFDPKERA